MPKILDEFPEELPLPQIRILQCLSVAKGPIRLSRIAERCGYTAPAVVATYVGSLTARSSQPPGSDTLLSLGYVAKRSTDVDGVIEHGVVITETGRAALEKALARTGGNVRPIPRQREATSDS